MPDAQALAAQYLEAFNAHDEEGMRRLTADGSVFEGPGDVSLAGADATTEYAMNWLNAFPDARLTVHNEIVSGDWVVQEFSFDGTHSAPLASPMGEVPATGRTLSGRGVQLIRFEDGLVADTRLYFDQVQVMTQLGLMPEPATA
jgi:steroid delta-isomerase-like uncharacterized protein